MFRVILGVVLMLLVSLPNGMCFCHAFDDVHADVDPHELPDDEHDCPCCELKPALACDVSQVTLERDGKSEPTLVRMPLIQTSVFAMQGSHYSSRLRSSIPLPLLHCALSI